MTGQRLVTGVRCASLDTMVTTVRETAHIPVKMVVRETQENAMHVKMANMATPVKWIVHRTVMVAVISRQGTVLEVVQVGNMALDVTKTVLWDAKAIHASRSLDPVQEGVFKGTWFYL